jgi:thiol:disulfide interchange protein
MKRFVYPISLLLMLTLPLVAAAQQQNNLATVSTALNVKAVPAGSQGVLAVVVEIRSGYHAQSSKPRDPLLIPFAIKLESNPQVELSDVIYPPGEIENFPALGIMSVYNGRVIAYVPFRVKPEAPAGSTLQIKGTVTFQICNDRTCFAPQTRPISVDVPIVAADAKPESANGAIFENYKPGASTAPATQAAEVTPPPAPAMTASSKQNWSIATALGVALVVGLLFNIMPCVLPVLPLKIVGFYEAARHSRARAFALGVVFSGGIIAVFIALSLLVLVFKAFSWGDLFTYGWFVWGIVILLLFMAAGLLGGWNFSLPLGVYTFEPRHDTFGGNFFWGALSAVLATPCTAPLLPTLLLWATLQPVLIGIAAMITVGIGMSLPYLILSAFPEVAKRFPRTGPWSELFKQMMGFLLIASAAYFGAGRLIAGANFWWAVTAAIAAAAAFLVIRTVKIAPRPRPIIIATLIAVVLLGSSVGWTLSVKAGEANWEPYTDARFAELRSSGKPVLVKFTANLCATCQVVEGTVFRDANVWKAIKSDGVTALKVDLTQSDAPGKALLLSLNPSGGIPLTAIWSAGDSKAPAVQLESIYTSNDMLQALKQIKSLDARAQARESRHAAKVALAFSQWSRYTATSIGIPIE